VDVIATGYVGPPIFVGNSLLWSVADVPGLPTRLVARNAAKFPARQETGIPAALRGISPSVLGGEPPPGSPPAWEVSLVASYGGAMAYFAAPGASGALTDLYYSPAPSQPIRLVLRLSGASTFSAGSLALGAGFLGWSLASGTSYVASSASLAAAALTNGTTAFGSVQAAGRFLIAASSPDPTQASRQLSVLSGATIRRLACARALPAGG
jgi:hypothetical protein